MTTSPLKTNQRSQSVYNQSLQFGKIVTDEDEKCKGKVEARPWKPGSYFRCPSPGRSDRNFCNNESVYSSTVQ